MMYFAVLMFVKFHKNGESILENQEVVFAGYDPALVMRLLFLLKNSGFTQDMISEMGGLSSETIQQIKSVVLGCGRINLQAAEIVDTNEVSEVEGCKVLFNHARGLQLICVGTIKLVKVCYLGMEAVDKIATSKRQKFPNYAVAKAIYNNISFFNPFPELESINEIAIVFFGTKFRSPNGTICFPVLTKYSNGDVRLSISSLQMISEENIYFAHYIPSRFM